MWCPYNLLSNGFETLGAKPPLLRRSPGLRLRAPVVGRDRDQTEINGGWSQMMVWVSSIVPTASMPGPVIPGRRASLSRSKTRVSWYQAHHPHSLLRWPISVAALTSHAVTERPEVRVG